MISVSFRTSVHRNERRVPTPYISSPPPQTSPQHILSALSDESIQRILTYLIGDIRNYLSAAEVCKRFQENAIKSFPKMYVDFDIPIGFEWEIDHIPLCHVKNFLNIFGHLMTSMAWDRNHDNSYEREVFSSIADFCGNTLVRSIMEDHHFDFGNGSQFKSLEELKLIACNVNNFRVPEALKQLQLTENTKFNSMNWMSSTYANLSEISLMFLDQQCDFNDEILAEFLALNPQLQKLHVLDSNAITSSIFEKMASRVPNLIDFEIQIQIPVQSDDIIRWQCKLDEDIIHLSNLRHLRRLHIHNKLSSSSVIDALVENNVPIESLEFAALNPCNTEIIAQLPNITTLILSGISYERVFDLVMNLPALQHLQITNSPHISLNGLKRILVFCQHLKTLQVFDDDILIDSGRLKYSVWDLVRHRVKLEVTLKDGNRLTGEYSGDCRWFKIWTNYG